MEAFFCVCSERSWERPHSAVTQTSISPGQEGWLRCHRTDLLNSSFWLFSLEHWSFCFYLTASTAFIARNEIIQKYIDHLGRKKVRVFINLTSKKHEENINSQSKQWFMGNNYRAVYIKWLSQEQWYKHIVSDTQETEVRRITEPRSSRSAWAT
jgi:hypothetical protein